MADLRIVDAPLLSTVKGTEKIPTGGEGNFSVSVNQVADFAKLKWFLATEEYVDNAVGNVQADLNLHKNNSSNPHQVTKEQVGLANVDNTADLDKPVSNATQSAIITANSGKADKSYVDSQDQLKADKNTVEASLLLKADKTDLIASKIPSDGSQNQQEINDFGGAKWYNKSGGYDLGATVKLTNGDIVKSTITNNIINPNMDMTGWLKVGNLIIVNTVTEMISKNLKNGDVVKTLGYNNLSDNGGAIYVISNTATDYSIPLSNGKHAVFNDSFDIRKFGIRDSATLDQTEELRRMAAYADSRFYEIDFHNFSIMTPNITHFTTARGSVVKGLGFNFVHDIKNLNIVHDKTKTLQQGTCNLLFLPKSNSGGTFKLTNTTFDSYVPSFNIISGEYDGMMCGFLAKAHPDWIDFVLSVVSDFNFDFQGAKFKSPAISYNMSTAGIFSRSVNLDNLSGDYWGLYVNIFTKRLTANNVRGVFRNDLHAGSGRLLVTSLIHEEPELGGATVSQDDYVIRNCSSVNTSGEKHILFKHDSVGRTRFKSISVDNCIGSFKIYDFDDDRIEHLTTVDTVTVSNRALLDISLICIIGNLNITDVIESYSDIVLDNIIGKINIKGGLILNNAMGNFNGLVDSIYADSLVVNNKVYGLARSSNISIKSIEIEKLILSSNKLIECKFDKVVVHNFEQRFTGIMNNTIFNVAPIDKPKPYIFIGGFNTVAPKLADFMLLNATYGGDVVVYNSNLPTPMGIVNATSTTYPSSTITNTATYDPPSISANLSTTTTVLLRGAIVGDNVQAAFSVYNEGIEIEAAVSAANTVTVKFKNTSAAAVDLPSGTLTVKLI